MGKVIVHCGISIERNCGQQEHPVTEVNDAIAFIERAKITNQITYNNSPVFVSAVKYIGKKQGIETEFFLNGVSCGNDIEPIFADFNKALDMINKLGATED